MNKALLFLLNIGISFICFAQSDSTALPIYLRFPNVPKFTIYKAPDSIAFTRENLKKKPTIFMIFDPGCDHCQRETDSIITHINKFKKAQIIMITYLAHKDMLDFYHDFRIANHPEITMGSDPKFFFPTFFQVRNLPGIYVYDKKGKFKKAFDGTVSINKIQDAL